MEKIIIKYFADIEPIGKLQNGDWIDLRAAEDVTLTKGEFKLIPLGIAMKLPKGYEAVIAPRSSTFKNYGIIQTNHIGVIDNSYSGDNDQWMMPVYCLEPRDFVDGTPKTVIRKNNRICQFRIQQKQPEVEFQTVEHLDDKDRGGFGSTGR